MSTHLDDAALLAAELLARRWLPRQHPKVKRALIDADLWAATQDRLAQVGLRLIDNLYADHVSVALLRPAETAVFGEAGLNSHNNIDLPRDAVSLLVVLWALVILPKRERQAARAAAGQLGPPHPQRRRTARGRAGGRARAEERAQPSQFGDSVLLPNYTALASNPRAHQSRR